MTYREEGFADDNNVYRSDLERLSEVLTQFIARRQAWGGGPVRLRDEAERPSPLLELRGRARGLHEGKRAVRLAYAPRRKPQSCRTALRGVRTLAYIRAIGPHTWTRLRSGVEVAESGNRKGMDDKFCIPKTKSCCRLYRRLQNVSTTAAESRGFARTAVNETKRRNRLCLKRLEPEVARHHQVRETRLSEFESLPPSH
jgi:hypothetical protein